MTKKPVSPANSPQHPRRITARERSLRALELRKGGMSYRGIAKECGYSSYSSAYSAVMRELDRLADKCTEEAEQVRALELERLDDLYIAGWNAVALGSETAIDRCLRIMERRARLLGLDAPTTVTQDISLDFSGARDALMARIRELTPTQIAPPVEEDPDEAAD